MKKIITSALLALAIASTTYSACAAPKGTTRKAAHNDTTVIKSSHVDRFVTDTTTTDKGRQRITYFALIAGKLVKSNKSTADAVRVAKANEIDIELYLINGKRLTY